MPGKAKPVHPRKRNYSDADIDDVLHGAKQSKIHKTQESIASRAQQRPYQEDLLGNLHNPFMPQRQTAQDAEIQGLKTRHREEMQAIKIRQRETVETLTASYEQKLKETSSRYDEELHASHNKAEGLAAEIQEMRRVAAKKKDEYNNLARANQAILQSRGWPG